MENCNAPILEFDPAKSAIINPELVVPRHPEMPERVVLCFFAEAIEKLLSHYPHRVLGELKAESLRLPVYELDYHGKKVGLIQASVGAPMAAFQIEELGAMGATKFLGCGSCGVLEKDVAVGHLIIPTAAVRDEGVSYHYCPPSREIAGDLPAIDAIARTFERRKIPYIKAKTWTTDAFYRETPDKVARRKAEGCVCVEMEASAYMAVAQFRGATFGQILYAGDNLGGEEWDSRGFYDRHDVRAQLLDVALEACLEL